MKNMLLKKVKFGFTLAEVLITLGIIGVVAAMTIPTLIANTRSQQYRSRFKKTISTLSQAARMSQAQYGFDYAGLTKACGSDGASEKPDSTQTICALLNGTLTGATYFAKASDIPIPQSQKNKGYNIYSPYINFQLTIWQMHMRMFCKMGQLSHSTKGWGYILVNLRLVRHLKILMLRMVQQPRFQIVMDLLM